MLSSKADPLPHQRVLQPILGATMALDSTMLYTMLVNAEPQASTWLN
jgi:hypothetical protein